MGKLTRNSQLSMGRVFQRKDMSQLHLALCQFKSILKQRNCSLQIACVKLRN